MKKIVLTILVIVLSLILIFLQFKTWKLNNENKDDVSKEAMNKETISDNKNNVQNDKDIKYITIDSSEVYIPILMYHSISDEDPENTLLVPPSQFEEEMAWFKEEGYTPMLLNEVIESLETGKVPEKPVAITFDDGYRDNYTEAFRIMKKYDMKGTFFMITKNLDVKDTYMTSDMLKEMKEYGMGIESHTHNHVELNSISAEEQKSEVEESRKVLKEKV